MHKPSLAVAAIAALFLTIPASVAAQDEADTPPETHIITVSTFDVGFGEARQAFNEYIDTYIVPQSKANPHVLSFRIAGHAWGSMAGAVWMITEYASLTGLDLAEEWDNAWLDENYPEGTPEREAANEAFANAFLPYLATHVDQILSANMNRAK